ncbi:MAG: hypothetical protein J6U12_05130 [Candidatus Methanomethylophilaceae archaeon]|nr:hypothetical protein [Candidatus Methanomethylophilaceae archaeon]MBP5686040.1 hypothetical protein [Candidatus Methanomethylophilaceae archaeon]MBP5735418.1 hypothetical protein [Candidatus Methanomethylophilaceae archaeon]
MENRFKAVSDMESKPADKRRLREDLRKMPKILIVGELLLSFVLLRYLMNFTSMVSPTEGDWLQVWVNLQSIVVSLLMAILTVSSIIGIPSAKPQSWRTVVRSAVLLNIINWFYIYLERREILISGVVFDVRFIALLMVVVVVIMLLPQVRRFYTPPMMEVPPIKAWLRYIFNVPMDVADSFRFRYADEENKPEEKINE